MVIQHRLKPLRHSLSLLAFLPGILSAQIRVSIPKQVTQGEPFLVSYTYSGSGELQDVSAPTIKGANLVYGPAKQQSSSFQSINGHSTSSSSVTYSYTFIANQKGTLAVSAVTAVLNGKKVNVPGASIQVAAGSSRSASTSESYSTPSRGAGVYLYRAIPATTTVYEQQALPVTYRLYASSTDIELGNVPAAQYDGFIAEKPSNDDGQRQWALGSYQGKSFRTVDLLSEVLFPQHSGTLTIPALSLGLRIPLPSTSDDPFMAGSSLIDKTIQSTPVTIQVKPLPAEGKPTDFSGAVGTFSMHAELVSTQPKTNESLTIRLTIEGQGNLRLAKSPQIQFPQDFEVYPNKETFDAQVSNTQVRGRKVIEYFAVPRHTGQVTIPALEFSFFDPVQGAYRTLRSQEFKFNITQGKDVTETDRSQSRADLQRLSQLRPEEHITKPTGLGWVNSFSFWLCFPLIALIGYAVRFIIARRRGLRADSWTFNASRAGAVATKRLRRAAKLLKLGDRSGFYEEVLRTLWGYLGDKLRLPLSELNRSTISDLLIARGMETETITELTTLLDEIEFSRYAPAEEGDMALTYDRTAQVISAIESHKANN